jgi:hypothetical protein
MNNKIKNGLGLIGIVLAAVFAWSVVSYTSTYSKSIEPSSFRNFSVTAEAEAIGIPDIAEFTVGVLTEGGIGIADLQEENNEKISAITSFIKEKGVEEKDIKTSGYSISPRYQYHECYGSDRDCPPPEIVGYSIRSNIAVKARDFAIIGDILSGVVDKGANVVSDLKFAIDDEDSLKSEARNEAIEKANKKAAEIAESAGFKVGRLLSISEGYYSPVSYDSYSLEQSLVKAPAAAGLTPVSVSPGSQEITSTVTLVYEIR